MLGAIWARIEYDATPETTIVLVASGDMGDERNLVFPRTLVDMESDFALVESTYGYAGEGAVPGEGTWESLRPFLQDIGAALAAKKMVIIPAFVTDRSHKVIAALQYGMREKIIPASIPIHLTSSTAADLVDVYASYAKPGQGYHTETFHALFRNTGLSPYRPANLRLGQQNEYPRPSIVIAHSAMMDQGESKRLLEEFVDDPGVHIVIVGYQAPQSPGGRIKNMSETTIVLAGRERQIKASRVSFSHLFSSHARGAELTKWLLGVQPRESIFIVHGSSNSADALRRHLETHPSLSGRSIIPKYLERYPLLSTRVTQPVVYQEPRVAAAASRPMPGTVSGGPAGVQTGTAAGTTAVAPRYTASAPPARTQRLEVGRPAVTSIRGDAVTISRTLTINGVVRDISNNVRWPASIEFRDAALKATLSRQVATAHALSTTAAPLIVTKVEATPINRGSVIAEAMVELNNGLRLKGVRLLKNRDGERASPPAEKKDGQWINHARFGNELEEQIRRAIREELNRPRR
jgi:Cft2 family RNA processing exonuclease